jgi:predicted MFS family arabinose efflux permease
MNKKRLWAVLAGVSLGRLAFAYQVQTIASLTPYFVQLGIGYATLGTLIGAYLVPGAFAALPLGLLGRRFGEHGMLAVGLLLMTIGNCIPLLSPDVSILITSRVVAGLGAVAMSVMFGKVMAELFQGSQFVAATGLAVSAFPMGVGLSQMANPLLVDAFGWRAAFLAGAALAGVATLLVLAGRPDPAARAEFVRFSWPSRRECGLMAVAGLVWTAYNAGYYGFMSYVPALLLGRGVSIAMIGWVMTLATWISVPAILIGGAVVARVGVMPVFLLGGIALSGSIAGIALSDHWLLWCVLFGTIGALHPGIVIAAGTLSARPEHRAVGMGLFYTTYYIGGAVLPALCGRAADQFGTPAAALLTAAALSVLTIPLFLWHQWLLRPAHSPCMTSPVT